jgi:hypothetical protein
MSYTPTKEQLKLYEVTPLEHLEALKDIVVAKQNEEDIRLEQTFQYGIIKRELYEYDKLKTPPTEQEVCEALGKWFKKEVKFNQNEKMFYYIAQDYIADCGEIINYDEIICSYGWGCNYDTLSLATDLPPHLITLIGRFYEGKVKDNEEHI